MIVIKYLAISLVTATSIFVSLAQQSATQSSTSTHQPVIVVATVNIYNATSTQKVNEITVSFDITNRIGIQPGVKYSLVLVKETKEGQTVMDEHVYDEVLNLGENSSIHKTIVYNTPTNIEGEYKLFVSSKNTSGFPFGLGFAGRVFLKKNNNTSSGITIDTSSCFLTVENEKSGAKYNPLQGVDISLQENLQSNCIVENTSDKEVTVTPLFVTRARSNFGEIVSSVGENVSPVTFAPKEKKVIVTTLPKASNPQSYNVSLRYGQESNEISYHYVIQGGSGTIQNLLLDKTIYTKGDIAKLSFMWTPSADGFPGSRKGTSTQLTSPSYTVAITDEYGKQCSQPKTEESSQKQALTKTDISISQDCVNPKVEVTLTDANLGVLAHSRFETAGAGVNTLPKKETKSTPLVAIAIIGVLALITLTTVFFYRKRAISQTPVSPLLVMLFLGVLFSGVGGVKAETFTTKFHKDDQTFIIFNIGSDKSTYALGENVIANWSFGGYPGIYYATVVAGATSNVYVGFSGYVGPTGHPPVDLLLVPPKSTHVPPLLWFSFSDNIGQTITYPHAVTIMTPVTPVCAATHYNCTSGTVGVTAEYSDKWQWQCNGTTQNLLCSQAKPTVNIYFSFFKKVKDSLGDIFALLKNTTLFEPAFASVIVK